MSVHHVMQDSDQIKSCPYCGSDVSESVSCENRHWESVLYKEITCGKCRSKRLIKMDFMGDGNDNWFDEVRENLDQKVKKAESKKDAE